MMSPRSFSKPVSGLILIMLLMPVLAVGIDTGQQTYAAPEPPVPAVAGYEGTLYTGQLHNHAGEYGDDGTGTVEANLAYMKGTADPAFQFGGLSPHSHMLTDSGMLSYWGDMAPYTDAGFVGIHAQEWSSLSSSNHVNVYLGSERCAVANGDIPGFYSWLDTSGGYGSFNHPGYGSDMNNWQYYPSVDKPGNFAGKMIMMEMDKTPGSDSDFPDYLLALSKGWHIGISVSDDNHGGDPGDMYANRPRTGMWLESLTPGGVEAAFQELRFFGSQLVDGYIDIEAGGHTMGDVFTGSSGTLLTAMLNPSYSYSSVEIFIDGAGHTMTQLDAGHYTYTIDASQSHYYFVRAAEYESGSYIISSPIWTGGGEPVPETPEPPTNVTAELSGPDVVVRWDLSPDDAAGTSMASFEPGEDAQVVSGYPSNNYGSVDYMYVQSDVSTVYLNERSWLKFNLAGQIPADADITAASLSLYCYKANGANMDATAHQVDTDSWTEGGITWNSQPFYGAGLDTVSLQVGVIGVRYEWDVTSFAQSQWSGDKVMSLVVKPSIESSPTTQTYAFEASENPDTAVRPRLMIWYTSAVSGIHYEVYRGTSYDPSGSGYSYVGQSPSLSTSYIDTGRGDGNPIDY